MIRPLTIALCWFCFSHGVANASDVDRELRRLQNRAPTGIVCAPGWRVEAKTGRCIPRGTVCPSRQAFDAYTGQCERIGRRAPDAYVGPSERLSVPLSRRTQPGAGGPIAPIRTKPFERPGQSSQR